MFFCAGDSNKWVEWYASQSTTTTTTKTTTTKTTWEEPVKETTRELARESASDLSRGLAPDFASASNGPVSVGPGVTLLEEAASEFGTLQVLKYSETHKDRTFAGAVVLQYKHTPDAVLSEYRENDKSLTGGVFDLFAMLPPLIGLDDVEYAPVGIMGVGAGTTAREFTRLYPRGKFLRHLIGWELNGPIIYLARKYFGLEKLEILGAVTIRIGDAFEEVRKAAAREKDNTMAGLVVDLFDEKSRVLTRLTEREAWEDIANVLSPGGRVVANLSTGRGKGADFEAAVKAAELAAVTCGGGQASVWRSGAHGIWNEVVLTGQPPHKMWEKNLPPELRHLAGDWFPVTAPPGAETGWILDALKKAAEAAGRGTERVDAHIERRS